MTGNGYLTALSSTANFTTLTVGNNAVATESFVTITKSWLISLSISPYAVATQAWVASNNYLTTIPHTVVLLSGAAFTGDVRTGTNSCTCVGPTCNSITPACTSRLFEWSHILYSETVGYMCETEW